MNINSEFFCKKKTNLKNTSNKDFGISKESKRIKIRRKGMSGKIIRMNRIFKADGKTVIVALDHGQFQGPIVGIADIQTTLKNVKCGQADAVILNPGAIQDNAQILGGDLAVLCRITGASTNYSPSFDYHRLISSVRNAISLGADGVVVMGFIGGSGENQSLELLGRIAEDCSVAGVPLIAEMLPQSPDHFTDPKFISLGVRVAYELGADIVKVYYTDKDSFSQVINSAKIPVVIAGGPKGKDALETAKEAIELGAKGVAYGRNVFQAEDQADYVRKLVELVHS